MGRMEWSVVSAVPRKDYTIELGFLDGKHGVYDAKPLLALEVFEPLKQLPVFMKAHAANGTVSWTEDIDIAPEHLYETCVPVE